MDTRAIGEVGPDARGRVTKRHPPSAWVRLGINRPEFLALPPAERIMAEVEPVTETGCWLFTGPVNYSGYGQCGAERAHRAAYRAIILLYSFLGLKPAQIQMPNMLG